MGKNDDTGAHVDGNPCIPGVDAIVEMERCQDQFFLIGN